MTLTGRARDLYISGGENVYPAQVEAVYLEHPSVREIAVVGVPDARWGEVGRAFVVLADGASLDPDGLAHFGRERLARFKVPRDFVAVDALPRTVTGKVQKFALDRGSLDYRRGLTPSLVAEDLDHGGGDGLALGVARDAGWIGSASVSSAAASDTGKSPSRPPRSRKHSWRCSGIG